MYEPVFNSVLVQIDDKDAEWGSGNDDSMLGKSYSKGTVIEIGNLNGTYDHPTPDPKALKSDLNSFKGCKILWNEGAEAGTTFEFEDKLFGMIYWWDVRGVLVELKAAA